MKLYNLTSFEKDGKKILDESFEAATDDEAKSKASQILSEKGLTEQTYRCVSPSAQLILFHS